MKTLKFVPELCEKILSGEKTSTWRLFDDKDIQEGDELEFINKETHEVIGVAKVSAIKIKTIGALTDEDWDGHELYASEDEMYKTFRVFYGDKVNPDTEVKIIDFTFQPT